MSWQIVTLILGIVWALVAVIWIAGWVSTFDKDKISDDCMDKQDKDY